MTPDELDDLLRALAHRERCALLVACRGDHRAAGDLAGASTLSSATVSEHLKVLRKTGLLELEKDGRRWHYTSDLDRLDAVVTALTALRED